MWYPKVSLGERSSPAEEEGTSKHSLEKTLQTEVLQRNGRETILGFFLSFESVSAEKLYLYLCSSQDRCPSALPVTPLHHCVVYMFVVCMSIFPGVTDAVLLIYRGWQGGHHHPWLLGPISHWCQDVAPQTMGYVGVSLDAEGITRKACALLGRAALLWHVQS